MVHVGIVLYLSRLLSAHLTRTREKGGKENGPEASLRRRIEKARLAAVGRDPSGVDMFSRQDAGRDSRAASSLSSGRGSRDPTLSTSRTMSMVGWTTGKITRAFQGGHKKMTSFWREMELRILVES